MDVLEIRNFYTFFAYLTYRSLSMIINLTPVSLECVEFFGATSFNSFNSFKITNVHRYRYQS